MASQSDNDDGHSESAEGRAAEQRDAAATLLQPGMVLSHTYRVEALLGRGGLGEVYRARHLELETEHAIKVIRPELLSDATVLNLFRREAAILRRLRHDAIVSYDGAIRDAAGRMYLIMEYIEGVSLSEFLKQRALTREEWRTLRTRLVRGLAAAHAQSVVHRDLSPDNVIFPGGEIHNAKIIDFGISRSGNPEDSTIIGQGFAGKYNFASPEQVGLFGGQVDARSDLYSLGLVLAAAAIGRPLEMGSSLATVAEARQSIPDLSLVPEDLRAELSALLQPDPALRPQSAAELLGGARPGTGMPSPDPGHGTGPGQEPRARGRGRRLAGLVAASLVVVALAGTAGYVLIPRDDLGEPAPGDEAIDGAEIPPAKPLEEIADGQPDEIYSAANAYEVQGDLDTALVLFEIAADKGSARAALALGEMYDPVLWGKVPSPFTKPNTRKAEQWYEKAVLLGDESARPRIDKLKAFTAGQ